MLLELTKALSFLISLLSLYPMFWNAFFVPGTRWEERLVLSFSSIGLSGCMCFLSGLVFCWPARGNAAS